MSADDLERRARLSLAAASEPNDVRLADLVHRHGPVETLARLRRADGPAWQSASAARLATVDAGAVLDQGARIGARFVVPGDLEWPSQLDDLRRPAEHGDPPSAPPLGLWLRGPAHLRASALRSVAVVGSRAASSYGVRVAAEMCAGLADRGWATVSGGAFGIDAAVHRGSLAGGGVTVAVLACGVDQVYPRSHASLLRRVGDSGLLVSELPLGAEPTRARFLDRNRLIAGLAPGIVLVEAAFRSGALNTARWGRRFGRRVMGVPGPATSPLSAGVHRELRERAALLVTGAADVVAELGSMRDALAEAAAEHVQLALLRGDHLRPGDELEGAGRRVLDALSRRVWRGVDDLTYRALLDPDDVAAALEQLVRAGLAEQDGQRWRAIG